MFFICMPNFGFPAWLEKCLEPHKVYNDYTKSYITTIHWHGSFCNPIHFELWLTSVHDWCKALSLLLSHFCSIVKHVNNICCLLTWGPLPFLLSSSLLHIRGRIEQSKAPLVSVHLLHCTLQQRFPALPVYVVHWCTSDSSTNHTRG